MYAFKQLITAATTATAFAASPAMGALLDFETAGQVANNFSFLEGTNTPATYGQTDPAAGEPDNDYLQVLRPSTNANRVTLTYTGDTYTDSFNLNFDAFIDEGNGSVGVYVVNADDTNQGILALFNANSAGDQLRVWSNADPDSGGIGTLIYNSGTGTDWYDPTAAPFVAASFSYRVVNGEPVVNYTFGGQSTGDVTLAGATPYTNTFAALRLSPNNSETSEIGVDNFLAVVPEPASLALLGLGALALASRRRA